MELAQGHRAQRQQSWPRTPDLCSPCPAACRDTFHLDKQAGPMCLSLAPGEPRTCPSSPLSTGTCRKHSSPICPSWPWHAGWRTQKRKDGAHLGLLIRTNKMMGLKGPGEWWSHGTCAQPLPDTLPFAPVLLKLLSGVSRDLQVVHAPSSSLCPCSIARGCPTRS